MSLGDFETQKKNLQEQIATAETEAEFTMDMSEVEKLNKQLEVLEATKHMYEDKVATAESPATENQIKQITDLGGSEEELVKREEVQDEKVEEVKEVLREKSEGVEKTDKQSSIEFYKKWDDERIKNKIAELAEKIQKFESKINDLDNMSPVERSQKVLSNPFGNFDATRGELIPKFKEENQKKIDSTIQEIAILEEVLEEKSKGVVEKEVSNTETGKIETENHPENSFERAISDFRETHKKFLKNEIIFASEETDNAISTDYSNENGLFFYKKEMDEAIQSINTANGMVMNEITNIRNQSNDAYKNGDMAKFNELTKLAENVSKEKYEPLMKKYHESLKKSFVLGNTNISVHSPMDKSEYKIALLNKKHPELKETKTLGEYLEMAEILIQKEK